jgi:hypothetical protein
MEWHSIYYDNAEFKAKSSNSANDNEKLNKNYKSEEKVDNTGSSIYVPFFIIQLSHSFTGAYSPEWTFGLP